MLKKVTLALPSKGAIAEPTLNFLRDSGLKVEKPNQRQYTGTIPSLSTISVLFQRVTDVVYKVADGTAQIGITGFDIVKEYRSSELVIIQEQLGYGHCNLVVAVPEIWIDVEDMSDLLDIALDFREQKQRNIRIATKYPIQSREFLYAHGIYHFTLVKAEGAIEAAPTLGYADLIIDLTQTGTTLRENHLKILRDGTIVESQACLIGNKHALRMNPDYLETIRILIEYIDATHNGKGYSQLIANLKGGNPQEVARKVSQNPVTRGLQGPTIAPIYSDSLKSDEQWYTVTIIISNSDLIAAMEYMRFIGGTQIIVSPVRYVFLEKSPLYQKLVQQLFEHIT